MTNIEVRNSIIIIFKKTERSDSTLHHSKFLVRYSAGFRSRLQRDSLFQLFVVSYKRGRWPKKTASLIKYETVPNPRIFA